MTRNGLLSFGAAQAAESPRWDRASVTYQSVDLDGDKFTGFAIAGSKLLGEDFFVVASYGNAADEDSGFEIDFNTLSLGLGYRYALSQSTDLFTAISYEDIEVEFSYRNSSESISENGYGAQIGVRSMVSEKIELSASIDYIKFADDTATGFSTSALYNFSDQFSAGVGYSKIEDEDTLSLSAVYFF